MLSSRQRAIDVATGNIHSPDKSRDEQIKYNAERLTRIIEAAKRLPFFLPVSIPMPETVGDLPIKKPTADVKEKTIITGAITDGEKKAVSFRRNKENAPYFVTTPDSTNGQISLEAIAGKTVEAGSGVAQINDFLPITLKEGESLEVSIYKAVQENSNLVSLVFTGNQVLTENELADYLTKNVLDIIAVEIDSRPTEENRYEVLPVNFVSVTPGSDYKTAKRIQTALSDETQLVCGFRSTFGNAKVMVRKGKDQFFQDESFPLFALATDPNNLTESFREFDYEVVLLPGEYLEFDFENTIDGSKYAQNGKLEIKKRTP